MPDGFRAAQPPTNGRRLRKVAGHLVRLHSVRGENNKIRASSRRVSINRDQNGSGPVHWPTVFAMVAKWRATADEDGNYSFAVAL
jgi:hypothetical protein